MNRRVPNGTHGGVRGRKSPLETFSYSMCARRAHVGKTDCRYRTLKNSDYNKNIAEKLQKVTKHF